MRRRFMLVAAASALALALGSCGGGGSSGGTTSGVTPTPPTSPPPPPTPPPAPTTSVTSTAVATLSNPWAMVFMPDGRLLVTERNGRLRVVTQAGVVGPALSVAADVIFDGQGGLLDVALDPAFATNKVIYLSYAGRSLPGTPGSVLKVVRATLVIDAGGAGRLDDLTTIWTGTPVDDNRHFGGRLAFDPDGLLYITAGERHQDAGNPAQNLSVTLGKIIRITTGGAAPPGNPFLTISGGETIWSGGHRNPYGLVFGTDGRLFESEMGPDAGDEFNIITRGANYGWRTVSEGSDGGVVLPKHSTRPDFTAPAKFWDPNIAPAGMIQYTGSRFVDWNGDFVLGGLVSQGLVQVRVSGSTATEVRRIPLGQRIREVEQGPDGAIWVLEDGAAGRLLKLVPAG